MKTTFSIIKADVGGCPGHSIVNEDLLEVAYEKLSEGVESGIIKDFFVTNCGDDLELIMTHD
ncbi:MAG: fructose 1,6-bisphosphatase, partial [Thermoplasmata archaeon]